MILQRQTFGLLRIRVVCFRCDKTGISLSESSPGNISFSVNSDTDNNNPTITALTIAGQSAVAKATITFDSAATISGIVLNDLDNADVGSLLQVTSSNTMEATGWVLPCQLTTLFQM